MVRLRGREHHDLLNTTANCAAWDISRGPVPAADWCGLASSGASRWMATARTRSCGPNSPVPSSVLPSAGSSWLASSSRTSRRLPVGYWWKSMAVTTHRGRALTRPGTRSSVASGGVVTQPTMPNPSRTTFHSAMHCDKPHFFIAHDGIFGYCTAVPSVKHESLRLLFQNRPE
jgi:hypothetical protein